MVGTSVGEVTVNFAGNAHAFHYRGYCPLATRLFPGQTLGWSGQRAFLIPEADVASLAHQVYRVRRTTHDIAGTFSRCLTIRMTVVDELHLLRLPGS